MKSLIELGDGTNRPPRPVQVPILNDLETTDHRITVVEAPPGIGKSYLARTLQRAYNAPIITVSNFELDKYHDIYKMDYLKGSKHYDTEVEYLKAREISRKNAGSMVFNYQSYFYSGAMTDTIIIDEAHNLESVLIDLATYSIPLGKTKRARQITNTWEVIDLMERYLTVLNKESKKSSKHWKKYVNQIERLTVTLDLFKAYSHKFIFEINQRILNGKMVDYLTVIPILPPSQMIWHLTRAKRVIMFSATMSERFAKAMLQVDDIWYRSYPHPAPIESRPIFYYPVKTRKSYDEAASQIRKIAKLGPTMVHVQYANYKIFSELLPEAITHTKNNNSKKRAVSTFKQRGGILLSAGLSEGVDLPYENCANVVVPFVRYPSLGDNYVLKRKSLIDGRVWYTNQAINTTRQELGRGHRAADDRCNMFVLCPTFPNLVKDSDLPEYFIDSINWDLNKLKGLL